VATSASSVSRSRLRRAGIVASVTLGAGVLALAPALSASAHDYLVASTPKAGSTQTKPLSKVVLTFDDRVLDLSGDGSSNVVEVTDSAQKHFESGCAAVADTDVSVPVALGDSGKYTVTWQIVSADGHTVSNSIAFTYAKPADAVAATGKDSRPTCGDQNAGSAGSGSKATSGSGAAASSSDASGGSNDLGIALGVGGGIIVLALAAVTIVLVRNRQAPDPEDDSGAGSDGGAAGGRQQPTRSTRAGRKQSPPPAD
jgi:methionine-rich copper-binding protein CopC